VNKRQTQTARILELLSSGREISALELSAVSLQYCARLHSLRKAGYVIKNRLQNTSGGKHGYYRLAQHAAPLDNICDRVELERKPSMTEPVSGSLFQAGDCYEYPD
jgi:Helix-turn-helix domain